MEAYVLALLNNEMMNGKFTGYRGKDSEIMVWDLLLLDCYKVKGAIHVANTIQSTTP